MTVFIFQDKIKAEKKGKIKGGNNNNRIADNKKDGPLKRR